jgi:hypothetical protein
MSRYTHSQIMFLVFALTFIGTVLLEVCVFALINRLLSQFYFGTMIDRQYMQLLKLRLLKIIETLYTNKYIDIPKKDYLLKLLPYFAIKSKKILMMMSIIHIIKCDVLIL